jgi:hypothetical protein
MPVQHDGLVKINYPAAEQRGIVKSIERPKGRGIEPSSAFYQPLAGWRIENRLICHFNSAYSGRKNSSCNYITSFRFLVSLGMTGYG